MDRKLKFLMGEEDSICLQMMRRLGGRQRMIHSTPLPRVDGPRNEIHARRNWNLPSCENAHQGKEGRGFAGLDEQWDRKRLNGVEFVQQVLWISTMARVKAVYSQCRYA